MKKAFQILYITLFGIVLFFLVVQPRVNILPISTDTLFLLSLILTLVSIVLLGIGWFRKKSFFAPSVITKVFIASVVSFLLFYGYILNLQGLILRLLFPLCNESAMGGTLHSCECKGLVVRNSNAFDYYSDVCVGIPTKLETGIHAPGIPPSFGTTSSAAMTIIERLDSGDFSIRLSDLDSNPTIVYRLIDLNADGQDEVMVMVHDSQCDSNAGCQFGIYKVTDEYLGERLTSVNSSSEFPHMTTVKTKGYFDLSFDRNLSREAVVWKWNGTEYQ
jgi:hypothetical protein